MVLDGGYEGVFAWELSGDTDDFELVNAMAGTPSDFSGDYTPVAHTTVTEPVTTEPVTTEPVTTEPVHQETTTTEVHQETTT